MRAPSKAIEPLHGLISPGCRFQQRGFAGAVAAEQGNDLAAIDLQARAIEDLHAAIAANEVLDLQHVDFPLD